VLKAPRDQDLGLEDYVTHIDNVDSSAGSAGEVTDAVCAAAFVWIHSLLGTRGSALLSLQ